MSKINDFGVGVIYNWEYEMSFSTNLNDYGLLPPSQMSSSKKEKVNIQGQEAERYKARFMYVGLSVQLPTKARMEAHLKLYKGRTPDGKERNHFMDVFHTTLRQATQNTFSQNQIFNSKRNLNNAMNAAQIINVCSFFDLGLLESYYIESGAKNAPLDSLAKSVPKGDFPKAMELASMSSKQVVGVNSASGDQGGPTRQADMANRGKIEWILAAYYAIYEGQQDVLNARTSHSTAYAAMVQKIKSSKKAVDIKVFDFIQEVISIGKTMASDAILSFLKSITFEDIQKVVKTFALGPVSKDGITGDMTATEYVKDRDILNFLEYFNLDVQQMQVLQFDAKSGISVQKRAEFFKKIFEDPLLNGSQGIVSLKANIKKAVQQLDISPRFGGSVAVKINEAKKLIQEQLANIAKNQAEYQALNYTAEQFRKEGRKILANLKEQLKENFEITNLTLDVYEANKDKIAEFKAQRQRSIEKSLNEIQDILEDALTEAGVQSGQLSMVAGKVPKKKK